VYNNDEPNFGKKPKKGLILMSRQVHTCEWVAKAHLHTENGESWVLDYYLQASETQEGETIFGLRVDKSTPGGVLEEREETPAVTESRETALEMAKAFAKGSVSPIVLLEMVDDWLGCYPPSIHTTG
jgi:hypothetical protein